jgi:hypothetical protein
MNGLKIQTSGAKKNKNNIQAIELKLAGDPLSYRYDGVVLIRCIIEESEIFYTWQKYLSFIFHSPFLLSSQGSNNYY